MSGEFNRTVHHLIEHPQQWNELNYWLENCPNKQLAVDFEFFRRASYRSQLCLILLANDSQQWLIDALSVQLQPLVRSLLKSLARDYELIFYSLRQDLEIFSDLIGELPRRVIDIQQAGIYFTNNPQPAQTALSEVLLQQSKSALMQCSDWRQRPLSTAQLDYAYADIGTIWQMFRCLEQRLNSRQWQALREDSAWALQTQCSQEDTTLQSQRMAHKFFLNNAQQDLLLELLEWRQHTAANLDIPLSWLFNNKTMLELCGKPHTQIPSKIVSLGFNQKSQRFYRVFNSSLRHQLNSELRHILKPYIQLRESQADQWNNQPSRTNPIKRLSDQQQQLYQQLQQLLQLKSEQHKVKADFFGGKDSLYQLISQPHQTSILKQGWRKYLLGEELNALLNQ